MHIKTERLSLRPVSESDAPFLFELMTSDSWIKNIGDRGIKTLDDAKFYASNNLIKSYTTNGYGLYVVCLEANPIGLCGLVKRDYLPLPDLGFALLDSYVGKGYIQESGKAILEVAFSDLKFEKILAITSQENSASQSTLTKLGFENKGTMESPEGLKMLLFEKVR